MDLNREPFTFNSTVNISVRVLLKTAYRVVIVARFGEDFYRGILQSPRPFVVPRVTGYQVYLYIFV